MNKSVYSLVLIDEIVDELDAIAYERATSRSNLINQILAEYISYVTPETRMREMFEEMESMMRAAGSLQLLFQPSDAIMSLRSSLSYKYNPTIKYSIELYRHNAEYAGEVRVTLRSQNSGLLLGFIQFFKLWAKIESRYTDAEYSLSENKYVRKFRMPPHLGTKEQGNLIAAYVDMTDKAIKLFFDNPHDPDRAAAEIERLYRGNYLKSGVLI